MPKTSDSRAQPPLVGRRAQAARNDEVILDAARAVFLADAHAPIAAVAERAGVGIGALYRRYPSKEILLRTLCSDGLRRYALEADAALQNSDGWQGLVDFLQRVVDADVHSLTVHLAGMFTPDDSMLPDVAPPAEATDEIVRRAQSSGRLRPGVTAADLGIILESCAAISASDPERAAHLRRRLLALLVTGLTVDGELPGPPPEPAEFAWRWQRR
ncbi:helix-turn-helix domain-containing protein [Nocardia sp. NPDC052001]|uniref:TetR/AcrR family transcriptional regulator n=1 Tax=Nocardia sp. NPDC052001 TaxID=3154853 RepID=UPI003439E2CC